MQLSKIVYSGVLFLFLAGSVLGSTSKRISMSEDALFINVISVEEIARITGTSKPGEIVPNSNSTSSDYSVHGTDLGIMWDAGNGEIFVAFGDTYGKGWSEFGAGPYEADWRSNVLAKSSDANLSDGLTFSAMVQDEPGHAKEILLSQKDSSEWTVIPTAGVHVGDRDCMHYMSVRRWGEPGEWFTNYAGIACSKDAGQTWVKTQVRWHNEESVWGNNFQQASFIKSDSFVYMFATPNGRRGDVYVARVREDSFLDQKAWLYWNGNMWSVSQESAKPIVDGPAGELSVVYNEYFDRFLMVYLDEHRKAIVMRSAQTLTGSWSEEKVIVDAHEFPGLYGGFIHPWMNNEAEMWFVMSEWGPYNTFLMRVRLG